MLRFTVLVEDNDTGSIKDYAVDVSKLVSAEKSEKTREVLEKQEHMEQKSGTDKDTIKVDTDPLMCLELSKLEYEHSFRRSEKFDNKVYILLTVCGFLFVLVVNAISSITDIEVFRPEISGWIVVFDIFLVMTIVAIIILLGFLIYCLSGIKMKRYDSNLTMEMNLTELDKTTVARFAIMEYEIAKKYNNDKLEKRFDWLNRSVNLLIGVVFLLMALSVSGSFAKSVSSTYREMMEMNQGRSVDDIIDEIDEDLEYLREIYQRDGNFTNESDNMLNTQEGEKTEEIRNGTEKSEQSEN